MLLERAPCANVATINLRTFFSPPPRKPPQPLPHPQPRPAAGCGRLPSLLDPRHSTEMESCVAFRMWLLLPCMMVSQFSPEVLWVGTSVLFMAEYSFTWRPDHCPSVHQCVSSSGDGEQLHLVCCSLPWPPVCPPGPLSLQPRAVHRSRGSFQPHIDSVIKQGFQMLVADMCQVMGGGARCCPLPLPPPPQPLPSRLHATLWEAQNPLL